MSANQKAVSLFNELAELYQSKYMDVSMYANELLFFCAALPQENARVLDIACGPGNVSRFLLDNRKDLQLLGIDLAPNMIELAKRNNPTARFLVRNGLNLDEVKEQFDGIVCSFYLPYLDKNNVLDLLKKIKNLLQLEGVLYLSNIDGLYEKSALVKGSTGDEIMMHYYPLSFLEKELNELGFSLLLSKQVMSKGKDGQEVCDNVLIARKQSV